MCVQRCLPPVHADAFCRILPVRLAPPLPGSRQAQNRSDSCLPGLLPFLPSPRMPADSIPSFKIKKNKFPTTSVNAAFNQAVSYTTRDLWKNGKVRDGCKLAGPPTKIKGCYDSVVPGTLKGKQVSTAAHTPAWAVAVAGRAVAGLAQQERCCSAGRPVTGGLIHPGSPLSVCLPSCRSRASTALSLPPSGSAPACAPKACAPGSIPATSA